MTNRLETLETDVALLKHNAVHATELLVDHSNVLREVQRGIDGLARHVDGLARHVDGLARHVDGLTQRVDSHFEAIESRLDRLIALTLEERTAHYERLEAIERRLPKSPEGN